MNLRKNYNIINSLYNAKKEKIKYYHLNKIQIKKIYDKFLV